jgi:hypothetical protein
MVKKTVRKTPVRNVLDETSDLLPSVGNGLAAIDAAHRDLFDRAIRSSFADSLDLDRATKQGREEESRWDYLLGYEPSDEIVAVEPHSAKDGQVQAVVKKRVAARGHLKDHLRKGATIRRWLWVSAGKVHFANTEKTTLLLLQNGIEFVGSRITAKQLLHAPERATSPRRNEKR